MPEVSESTISWARIAFENEIDNLLDDPSWAQEDLADYLETLNLVAKDLGLNLEVLLSTRGSAFERARMQELRAKVK